MGEEEEIRNMGPMGHMEYRGGRRHERHTAKGTWGHRGMGIGGMWPLGVASICPWVALLIFLPLALG